MIPIQSHILCHLRLTDYHNYLLNLGFTGLCPQELLKKSVAMFLTKIIFDRILFKVSFVFPLVTVPN